MPNPSRPVYKDVIDDQWGQLVADRVIRRYASTAERDADMSGILDLAGQVCAITVAPGSTLLYQHDGVAWAPLGGRFARVICDGSSNVVVAQVPPSAMSVRVNWWGDSDGAIAQHNMNLNINGDQSAQYSDTVQWLGTVAQFWNRPGPNTSMFIGQMRGGNGACGGRIHIPFCNRDNGIELTSVLFESESNMGGVTGVADPTVLRMQGAGHYWDALGGRTTSLRISISPGNFKAGSIFDFFGE